MTLYFAIQIAWLEIRRFWARAQAYAILEHFCHHELYGLMGLSGLTDWLVDHCWIEDPCPHGLDRRERINLRHNIGVSFVQAMKYIMDGDFTYEVLSKFSKNAGDEAKNFDDATAQAARNAFSRAINALFVY